MSVEPGTDNPDVKKAAFGRFAFKGRNSNSSQVISDATALSDGQVVNSPGSVQGHPGQRDSVRSVSSKDKPVRREKRNINASIFDDSDDETNTAMDQMLPPVHRQHDIPKTSVSCECLCEHCAS